MMSNEPVIEETQIDYSEMTIVELKEIAKEKGVKGYYKYNKSELIEILNSQ